MTEQATWVPVPKGRKAPVKTTDVLSRVNRLAEWYRQNKPEVRRVLVTKADFKLMEGAAGTNGITVNDEGVHYRGYRIEIESAS